jgi:hypothetical protein
MNAALIIIGIILMIIGGAIESSEEGLALIFVGFGTALFGAV